MSGEPDPARSRASALISRVAPYVAPAEGRDALRALGGVLVGLGLMMIYIRKGWTAGEWHPWSSGVLFVVLLLTTVFLYGVGLAARAASGQARAWQAIYVVFGVLVAPIAMLEFIAAIHGHRFAPLNLAWIFLVTGSLAAFAAAQGFRYLWLLAGLASIVAWSALWDKLLSHGLLGHVGLDRWLLLIIAATLFAAGWAVRTGVARRLSRGRALGGEEGAFSELVTAAAIAAVMAGAGGYATFVLLFNPQSDVWSTAALGWEIELLLVSILAVGYGAREGLRGPAYVGGIGLSLFLVHAALSTNGGHGNLVGWPLVLLVVGAVAFLLSLRRAPGTNDLTRSADRRSS